MEKDQYYYNTREYKENLEGVKAEVAEYEALSAAEAEEKRKEVSAEVRRLKKIFTEERCGKDNMHFVLSLVDRAAWLRVEIEHMEKKLQYNGMTELFRQGLQIMVRENPLSKIHEKYIKNYLSTITKLESYCKTEDGGKHPAVDDRNPIAGLIARRNSARGKYEK